MKSRVGEFLASAGLALLVLSATLVSCVQTSRTVVFHIPAGFSGVFRIEADKLTGEQMLFPNGVYHLQVPKSGVITLTNLNEFEAGFDEHFYASNGKELPYYGRYDNDHTGIRVYDLGYVAKMVGGHQEGGDIRYYVGSYAGYLKERARF